MARAPDQPCRQDAPRLGADTYAWHQSGIGEKASPMDLKARIRQIPDFPKPGILFYDISTLLQAPAAWRDALRPAWRRAWPRTGPTAWSASNRAASSSHRRLRCNWASASAWCASGASCRVRWSATPTVSSTAGYDRDLSGSDRAGQPRGGDRRPDRDRRHRRRHGRAAAQDRRRAGRCGVPDRAHVSARPRASWTCRSRLCCVRLAELALRARTAPSGSAPRGCARGRTAGSA